MKDFKELYAAHMASNTDFGDLSQAETDEQIKIGLDALFKGIADHHSNADQFECMIWMVKYKNSHKALKAAVGEALPILALVYHLIADNFSNSMLDLILPELNELKAKRLEESLKNERPN